MIILRCSIVGLEAAGQECSPAGRMVSRLLWPGPLPIAVSSIWRLARCKISV